jgi:hypothetical protein
MEKYTDVDSDLILSVLNGENDRIQTFLTNGIDFLAFEQHKYSINCLRS